MFNLLKIGHQVYKPKFIHETSFEVIGMHNIGIFGDTGIVGQEIQRILSCHDKVRIIYRKNSKREEGSKDFDLVFLATKDSNSMASASEMIDLGKKVIDMSGAFRLPKEQFEQWYGLQHSAPELLEKAVYGLPAYFKPEIAEAQLVANPGCYPTSVILALKPLEGLLQGEATVVSTSGNSGSGNSVEDQPNEVTYNYGTKHKHVPEMALYSGFDVNFTPIVLRSVFSGINTNMRVELADILKSLPGRDAAEKLRRTIGVSYEPEDNVSVVEDNCSKLWGTRDVVGTHKALIKIGEHGGYINPAEFNIQAKEDPTAGNAVRFSSGSDLLK